MIRNIWELRETFLKQINSQDNDESCKIEEDKEVDINNETNSI